MPMSNIVRIAVFYDGGYFFHVSNYYCFEHPRRARINLKGLHSFIQNRVSEAEQIDPRLSQVVEAHYFRGRPSVSDLVQKSHLKNDTDYVSEQLKNDRIFDEVLMRANIATHFFAVDTRAQPPKEVGIDVCLALEAYDLAVHKKFDVLALVACDGDYVPLVRKLNSIGTRVMLLAWDFKTERSETRTSQALINECSYPIMMHEEIDNRAQQKDPIIQGLFVAWFGGTAGRTTVSRIGCEVRPSKKRGDGMLLAGRSGRESVAPRRPPFIWQRRRSSTAATARQILRLDQPSPARRRAARYK
jgi:uncharacterized LabA/DUF88 family protein